MKLIWALFYIIAFVPILAPKTKDGVYVGYAFSLAITIGITIFLNNFFTGFFFYLGIVIVFILGLGCLFSRIEEFNTPQEGPAQPSDNNPSPTQSA